MTILQKRRQSGDRHAGKRWYRFGDGDQAVRRTDAWEHENFVEEQARWERSDPVYARICDEVRQANKRGGEASRRAQDAKAEWDARVAPLRQANDDAQRARHALKVEQAARRQPATSATATSLATEGSFPHSALAASDPRPRRFRMQSTLAIESAHSSARAIAPEPVGVDKEPAARTTGRGVRRAARVRPPGLSTRNQVSDGPTTLEVE